MNSTGSQLEMLYRQCLQSEDLPGFMLAVAQRYTPTTLERLTCSPSRYVRRAAVLALGLIGSYASNAVLARALHDSDRAVRLLAEDALRSIWKRNGYDCQLRCLERIERLNWSGQHEEAMREASLLICEAPWYGEAWYQRAVAWLYLEGFRAAAEDCGRVLQLNPYHFPAAIGLAQALLELGEPGAALDALRRALEINPSLELIRAQVRYLERSLEGG